MQRIALWLAATGVIVVLLFSYRTSTHSGAAPDTALPSASGPASPGVVTPAGVGATGINSSGDANGVIVVNGTVAQTQWGPVQVQVRIRGSSIVEVTPLVYPAGNSRDAEINATALPRLRQEVLQAQSGDIQGVSGATVTSDGYRESLQAALDAAHFKG